MNSRKLSTKEIVEYTIMGIVFFLPAIVLFLPIDIDPEFTYCEASLDTYLWIGVCIATYNGASRLGGNSICNVSFVEKQFIDIFRSLSYNEQKQIQKTINDKLEEIHSTRNY